MLGLRTFGALYLSANDGAPRDGAAGQRRLLALLAVLATADEAGVSRDRLLGLLWPESEPEKARHALTQTLYHTRKALDCDDLFIHAGSDIRLHPDRIATDAGAFTGFVAAKDFDRAAHVYRGPFLDGFHLPGSVNFDQWVSVERARFAGKATQVLEHLAARAEAAGDWGRTADVRKRMVNIDPLNGSATAKLMTALAAGGDRTAALQVAKVHEALVRDQLEMEPDRVVAELAARLRLSRATVAPTKALPELVTAPTPGNSVAAPKSGGAQPHVQGARRRPFGLRRTLIGAVAIASVVSAAFALRAAVAAPESDAAVLVAPFRVSGADRSLAYLSEGMVELLSTRLADDNDVRAVDPGVVLATWQKTRGAGTGEISREVALGVARRLHAFRLVVGSVVGSRRVVLSASVLVVATGEVGAEATIEGPADSITTLVDRMAVKLLAVSAGEGDRLSDRTSPSLAALRAFLSGQSAYRRGDYGAAMPLYERALREDSTFALAALQLALTADRVNDNEQHDRALAIAWANRADLSARDDAHLVAFSGPRYPSPSTESEQLAAWERAVALASDRAEVWYEVGARFFRTGAAIGVERAHDRAFSALTRALELDSTHTRARRLLILLAARRMDTVLLNRLAPASVLRDSLDPLAAFLRWRVALARGDEAELRHIRAQFPLLSDQSIRAVAIVALNDSVAGGDGARAASIRDSRARSHGPAIDGLLEQHAFALNEGRPARALAVTGRIEERDPGSRAHFRLRVLDALYANGDRVAGDSAADALGRIADAPAFRDPDAHAVQLADVCVVEQWRIAHGITRGTRRAIARLRAAPVPRTPVPVSANQFTCAAILDAAWSVATKQRDALGRVVALDSLMLSGPAVSDAATYAKIAVSRMYERLGNRRAALDALRRRPYMAGWPRYLGTMRSEEARLAASLDEY